MENHNHYLEFHSDVPFPPEYLGYVPPEQQDEDDLVLKVEEEEEENRHDGDGVTGQIKEEIFPQDSYDDVLVSEGV